jgi:hypothetical protein
VTTTAGPVRFSGIPKRREGATDGIPLQHENARAANKIGIILHDDGRGNTGDHVADEYIIGGKLIIAMGRNSDLSATRKDCTRRKVSLIPSDRDRHSAARA